MKSSRDQETKLMLLAMERLHTTHVRGHQGNGGVEDAVIEGGEIALLNEHGADFLQSQRIIVRACVGISGGLAVHAQLLKHNAT
jgi:hypothetical protein